MPLDLPKPVAEYFAADRTRDAHALARCFADDGVVHDEGGTFRGTEAIRDWSAATREKYHHTVEPLSAVERDQTLSRKFFCAVLQFEQLHDPRQLFMV